MIGIQAFIDSWSGRHGEAAKLAAQIEPECPVTVVYSEPDDDTYSPPGVWVGVPNDYYFGRKLQRCLELFTGDILLHIMADVTCEDWPALVRRCCQVFETVPDLGIWTPRVTGRDSPWDMHRTVLQEAPDLGLVFTSQQDQLVWAMSRPVVERMRQLDCGLTNLGWGIDVAATCYCHTHGLLTAQDTTVSIWHGDGTRYELIVAAEQMSAFIGQLSLAERLHWELLKKGYSYDGAAAKAA